MSDTYLGTIIAWAPSFEPMNWLFCNGQLLNVEEYSALFSLIGYRYGGDGAKKFALPNLNGRVPVGANTDGGMNGTLPPHTTAYNLGQTGGADTTTLTSNNLPAHIHQAATSTSDLKISDLNVQLPASTASANTSTPSNDASLAVGQDSMSGPANLYTTGQTNTYLKPATVSGGTISGTVSTTISPAGSTSPTPVDIRQPYIALNYIICVRGLWPPRPY